MSDDGDGLEQRRRNPNNRGRNSAKGKGDRKAEFGVARMIIRSQEVNALVWGSVLLQARATALCPHDALDQIVHVDHGKAGGVAARGSWKQMEASALDGAEDLQQ